jgi:cobyrinic acid a,c-diamide synthase
MTTTRQVEISPIVPSLTADQDARRCAFVVAGTHSGVGKTTVSLAVMGLLAERGYVVQPFKIGPDFIDPGYHRQVAGRASVNLDLWMMGPAGIQETFSWYCAGADVAVIEAMGGLYDGDDGTAEGSAASVARLLRLPVVLVVDVWGMTTSTAAVIGGFEGFDRAVDIRAVVLNRPGSRKHVEMILRALPEPMRSKVVGYLPASDHLAIDERHLGLVTPEENHRAPAALAAMVASAREHVALDHLIQRIATSDLPIVPPRSLRPAPTRRVRIAVAEDAAFCFYYRENLRLLEQAGAELIPFSPIADSALPEGVGGVYLGGGYPESFAGRLAANGSMHEALAAFTNGGGWIYGECGGLMYLGESLTDVDGCAYPMVGLLPLRSVMDRSHLAIRYVEVTTRTASPLGPAGLVARGQEFHQSRLLAGPAPDHLYAIRDCTGIQATEGFACERVVGSYVHLYFGSNPDIAASLVNSCP